MIPIVCGSISNILTDVYVNSNRQVCSERVGYNLCELCVVESFRT